MKSVQNLSDNYFFLLSKRPNQYLLKFKRIYLSNLGVSWENEPNSQSNPLCFSSFRLFVRIVGCFKLLHCVLGDFSSIFHMVNMFRRHLEKKLSSVEFSHFFDFLNFLGRFSKNFNFFCSKFHFLRNFNLA